MGQAAHRSQFGLDHRARTPLIRRSEHVAALEFVAFGPDQVGGHSASRDSSRLAALVGLQRSDASTPTRGEELNVLADLQGGPFQRAGHHRACTLHGEDSIDEESRATGHRCGSPRDHVGERSQKRVDAGAGGGGNRHDGRAGQCRPRQAVANLGTPQFKVVGVHQVHLGERDHRTACPEDIKDL